MVAAAAAAQLAFAPPPPLQPVGQTCRVSAARNRPPSEASESAAARAFLALARPQRWCVDGLAAARSHGGRRRPSGLVVQGAATAFATPVDEAVFGAELQEATAALELAYQDSAARSPFEEAAAAETLRAAAKARENLDGAATDSGSDEAPSMAALPGNKARGNASPPSLPPHRKLAGSKLRIKHAPAVPVVAPAELGASGGQEEPRNGRRVRRLSLPGRIALRKSRCAGGTPAVQLEALPLAGIRVAGRRQELTEEEVEELVTKYAAPRTLLGTSWSKSHSLLSASEESRLAYAMQPATRLQQRRDELAMDLGRDPTEEEWAEACGLSHTELRHKLVLGQAARNKLVEHNLRLVLSLAHKYNRRGIGLSFDDLCQQGLLGLMAGADRFDPGRGFRFSTYVGYSIRCAILRGITYAGYSCHVPVAMGMERINIRKAQMELLAELQRDPTQKEVARRAGMQEHRFADVARAMRNAKSIHSKQRTTGKEVLDTLEDASTPGDTLTMDLRGDVEHVLNYLQDREKQVLLQRFGLDGLGVRSLDEVGRSLSLSREGVRKCEIRALKGLRQPARLQDLRPYLAA
eukprot:SM000193S05159  [mRNA]  locus=s193:78441:80971:- [translate_table: standard]